MEKGARRIKERLEQSHGWRGEKGGRGEGYRVTGKTIKELATRKKCSGNSKGKGTLEKETLKEEF